MTEWAVRRADVTDADSIARLRLAFVREFRGVDDEESLRSTVREYLEHALPAGEVAVWLAETDGLAVGTGAVTVYERMMMSGVGREGYVLNMYTVPEWRQKGIGSAIVAAIVDHARSEQMQLALIATDAGRLIYERADFVPDNRYMRWRP